MFKTDRSKELEKPGLGTMRVVAILTATILFVVLSVAWRVQAVGELKIQYRYGDTATDSKIKPEMKLVNTTAAAILLSNVKIRYWFTADDSVTPSIYCDFATAGCANLTQTIVVVNPAKTNADRYLEIGFTSAAGSIAASDDQTIKVRLQKTTNYNDAND